MTRRKFQQGQKEEKCQTLVTVWPRQAAYLVT